MIPGAAASPTQFLERDADLARIRRCLAAAREGRGSVLVIEGPAGIGKTSLLASARAAAESTGMRAMRARGAQLERDFAFGVVRQLFEPALAQAAPADRAAALDGAAGLAARLLGLPGAAAEQAAPGTPDPSFGVLHGLYWLCANLAGERPLCLVIDDAHWADTPSLRYVSFLVSRLDELPLALLLAARPGEAEDGLDLLASLSGERRRSSSPRRRSASTPSAGSWPRGSGRIRSPASCRPATPRPAGTRSSSDSSWPGSRRAPSRRAPRRPPASRRSARAGRRAGSCCG